MTREEHVKLLEAKMKRNLEIAKAKNADYCGKGEAADPFHNFKAAPQVGVSVERGILVRMQDKIARVSALLDQEANVKDESIHDSLMDLSNYALILSNYLDSSSSKKGKPISEDGYLFSEKNYIGINDEVYYIGNEDMFRGIKGTVVDSPEGSDSLVVKAGKNYHLIPKRDVCLALI